MLSAVIVDDEPLALDLLSAILDDMDEVIVLQKCSNGYEAIDAVLYHNPDVLFIDIEMPEMTGFDVINSLQADILPKIIFTTAYTEYAVEAFKVQALNYVLKPLDEGKVKECVQRALKAMEAEEVSHDKSKILSAVDMMRNPLALIDDQLSKPIIAKENDKISVLDKKKIMWVEADGDYVCLHMKDKMHLIRATLKSIEGQLSQVDFQRIHRSTIINLRYLKELIKAQKGAAIVVMETGERLKVSRGYGAELRKRIVTKL